MTKHEIMEVLEDIASLRETQDIPLCYVEKYLDMLDEDSMVTIRDFCGDIPGIDPPPKKDLDEDTLYNEAGLL